jgi:hypothetical protein
MKSSHSNWVWWAAGLFDGEGSIGIYNSRVMLRVNMGDKEALEWFRRVVKVGTLRWCPSRPPTSASYVWTVSSKNDARFVLERFLPMMVVKRKQAMLALRYIDARSFEEKQALQYALKQLMNRRQGRSR